MVELSPQLITAKRASEAVALNLQDSIVDPAISSHILTSFSDISQFFRGRRSKNSTLTSAGCNIVHHNSSVDDMRLLRGTAATWSRRRNLGADGEIDCRHAVNTSLYSCGNIDICGTYRERERENARPGLVYSAGGLGLDLIIIE